jgi:hypothetical protein
MVNTDNIRIFNYINYITLACIVPIGYFAPMGEWLLVSFLALATIVKLMLNNFKLNFYNFYIILILIFLFIISSLWSVNPGRTIEVIGPTSGIVISIYIILNISASNMIKNIDNLIGIPLLLTSLCIFLDLVFNTEIRSSLALLAGDKPTSESGNFSRGIIILTMLLPISVSLFINNKKYILAFIVLVLVSTVIFLGPNESAKIALIGSYFSALIIYFLGPRSFTVFGILSLIIIIFSPLISSLVFPKIGHLDKEVEIMVSCVNSYDIKPLSSKDKKFSDIRSRIIINNKLKSNKSIAPSLLEFKKLELGSPVSKEMAKLLHDNNIRCTKIIKWQKSSQGSSIIHRLLIWEYVAKEILKRPILGHGLGTSRLIGQNIILKVPNTTQEIKGGIPLHPHNNFLEIWLELGLLGTIIISLLWIKIIQLGKSIRKNSYIIGTGVCTSIVTIFVMCNLSFGAFQAWWMASIGLIFLVIFQSYKQKKSI